MAMGWIFQFYRLTIPLMLRTSMWLICYRRCVLTNRKQQISLFEETLKKQKYQFSLCQKSKSVYDFWPNKLQLLLVSEQFSFVSVSVDFLCRPLFKFNILSSLFVLDTEGFTVFNTKKLSFLHSFYSNAISATVCQSVNFLKPIIMTPPFVLFFHQD